MEVSFAPVSPDLMATYINVGKQSYKEHYVHLWPDGDISTYISSSFSKKVVDEERKDPSTLLYVIYKGTVPVGVLKLIPNKALDTLSAQAAFHIQKIYLLNAYSGMGIGVSAIRFVENIARKMGKKILWLDTMQKGKALAFYQKIGFTILKASELHFPNAKPSEKAMWTLIKPL